MTVRAPIEVQDNTLKIMDDAFDKKMLGPTECAVTLQRAVFQFEATPDTLSLTPSGAPQAIELKRFRK